MIQGVIPERTTVVCKVYGREDDPGGRIDRKW
jgi:hypothetical protein